MLKRLRYAKIVGLKVDYSIYIFGQYIYWHSLKVDDITILNERPMVWRDASKTSYLSQLYEWEKRNIMTPTRYKKSHNSMNSISTYLEVVVLCISHKFARWFSVSNSREIKCSWLAKRCMSWRCSSSALSFTRLDSFNVN